MLKSNFFVTENDGKDHKTTTMYDTGTATVTNSDEDTDDGISMSLTALTLVQRKACWTLLPVIASNESRSSAKLALLASRPWYK